MASRVGKGFGFGGKLCAVLIVAAVCGFVWAMVERGLGPSDLVRIFRQGSGEVAAAPDRTTPPPPPSSAKPHDPGPDPRPDPRPDPPRTADPKLYSASAMEALFRDVESRLRAGQIKEARDKVGQFNKLLVPPEQAAKFRDVEARATACHKLLLETSPGAAIPMPEMAEIVTASGTRGIFVKNLFESQDEIAYETLTGIRARTPRAQVRELTKLAEPGRRAAALDHELERLCQGRGVTVKRDPGAWTFAAGSSVPGLAFFDLADFCARNGHAPRLVPLFDEALRRDPSLLDTVHEAKADRMIDVLLYFVSLHAKEDAKTAYAILRARYRDTRAYREKVDTDADVTEAYLVLVGERVARATAPPPPEDPPVAPPPPPDPVGHPPPPPDPDPVQPDPPPSDEDPDAVKMGKTELPVGSPEAIFKLCAQGDASFDQAMKHLRRSDSTANPGGWAAENKKALELFSKAFDSYQAAQTEFDKAGLPVPSSLVKRFRDTTMSRALCRKRAVSSKK